MKNIPTGIAHPGAWQEKKLMLNNEKKKSSSVLYKHDEIIKVSRLFMG